MADYIYLLENRLSPEQKNALVALRDVARAKGSTLFLVGGAVRDLTSGSPVRDLDVAVQGNALKLRKELELAGGSVAGSHDELQSLYMKFPGGVRVEVGSTMSVAYPKPGKPVLKPGTILEDLRRRDFTANAMALSLNEGSYGLLMDPLNGVADIENRELRLVSNYGFIEEPVRLIRASRFAARLGWTLEEKTLARYETGKEEGYISGLNEFHRGYEAEEIVHEEDPLRVMKRLESEGWMPVLAPGWNSSKVNTVELEKVRESQTQLQMQGIHPDPAAVYFPLLTAKVPAKDVETLKKSFPRPGFIAEIDHLESEAKAFATQLGGKAAAEPSAAYRMIRGAKPDVVLFVSYTTKSNALQGKFKNFFGEWPQVRQKIPFALLAEMRITPELPGYQDLVEKVFFELMDGRLSTTEEMRAFLEPFSPPAPPPPVHLRRPRAARKDSKKTRSKKDEAMAQEDAEDLADEDLDDAGSSSEDDEEEEVEDVGGTLDPKVEAELARVAASEQEDEEESEDAIAYEAEASADEASVKADTEDKNGLADAVPELAAPRRDRKKSLKGAETGAPVDATSSKKSVPAKAVGSLVKPVKFVVVSPETVKEVAAKSKDGVAGKLLGSDPASAPKGKGTAAKRVR